MSKRSDNIFFHFGMANEQIGDVRSQYNLTSLIILDQVHGINGHIITQHNAHMPFKSAPALLRPSLLEAMEGFQQGFVGQGDFLITDQRNIGLGILTADCLPIIFIDSVHNAIGIAHAGWRGSIKNIAEKVVACMQQQYGTEITDLSVFFGPCAKVCCYQVQSDFINNCELFAENNEFFVHRADELFFDLPLFNKSLLLSVGLPKTSINDQYNYCSICNDAYFSYRRQGDAAGRNVNVVWIV